MQQVRPPVLLEYDEDTNLKTVYLENTSRQFDRTHTEGTLAYVDRCTAPMAIGARWWSIASRA
ncbi:hypothetical protein XGA_0968 [Xanthomonas hortorum ATCC 19865]|nr:hypothetical protein XGA_0968 [Xanthomonas hortorum ATCC 19865]